MNDPFILSTGYNQKCVAQIAEPVLPVLKPETAGPLQSIMLKLKRHACMQCLPNAAQWISGTRTSECAMHQARGKSWRSVL